MAQTLYTVVAQYMLPLFLSESNQEIETTQQLELGMVGVRINCDKGKF